MKTDLQNNLLGLSGSTFMHFSSNFLTFLMKTEANLRNKCCLKEIKFKAEKSELNFD